MPLVFVQRYKPGLITDVGTQLVSGNLTLSNPTYVEFDPSLFNTTAYPSPSKFVIFQYGGTLTGDVSFLIATLTGTGYSTALFEHDSVNKQITVTLT